MCRERLAYIDIIGALKSASYWALAVKTLYKAGLTGRYQSLDNIKPNNIKKDICMDVTSIFPAN